MAEADNLATIDRLYAALRRGDGEAMAACYAPNATFTDPVFVGLRDSEPGDMWRMLTARSADLAVELRERSADGTAGRAHWVATYAFGGTGRRVVNDIRSVFAFDESGLIVDQQDDFDFWRWSRQALGPVGWLAGWTTPLQRSVRRRARAGLTSFRSGR